MDEIKQKVYQAAELIAQGTGESKEEALNKLGVSQQCGFASHSNGNNVGKEDMIKKVVVGEEVSRLYLVWSTMSLALSYWLA